MSDAFIVRRGGGGASGKHIPTFTYTGNYDLDISGEYEVLRLLTSGTLTFQKAFTADVFLVGGGGGGGNDEAPGGGGGYARTVFGMSIAGTPISCVIGAGGTQNQAGGTTSLGSNLAYGGNTAYDTHALKIGDGGSGGGGNGGSGGGHGGYGGSNGSDGETTSGTGGNGQGTTTYEFGDSSTNRLYSGGGGGGSHYQYGGEGGAGGGGNGVTGGTGGNGAANTGGGGGGGFDYGGSGGSGIICIRIAQ